VVSADGRFRYVSPASERVLGYSIEEMMTQSPLDFVYPRARTMAQAVIDRVASKRGAQEEFEVRTRHADGGWRWLNVTVTNRTDDPIVDGIVLNYRDITAHKGLEDRLHRQAFSDALTGLANRPLFIDRLEHALARRRRDGQESFAVLFMDIDDFKVVNDNLGHSAGDKLLVTLGQRLRTSLRPADTAARFGGDEFAILLEGANEAQARVVADRLLSSLGAPVAIGEREVQVTVSIGVAVDSSDAEVDADDVLREADLAMYSAKSGAPGTYAVYEPKMHDEALRRLDARTTERPPTEHRPAAHWQPAPTASLERTPAAT
jgi:diguanylate cyclase (GGDEF)-like protein/PAS domain S-box-containing protein